MSKPQVRAVATKDNITLHLGSDKVLIQRVKNPELFEEVNQLIIDKNTAKLTVKFESYKDRVKRFSGGSIEMDDLGQATFKGSNEVVPKAIMKKLLELEKGGEDFLPLIRFWKKLQKNPSQNSREQLYSFMMANNMSITEQGDILFEKGVSRKSNGNPEEFVDTHSGNTDYTIGCITQMLREKVQDNKNVACAPGLHVAPPDYVRKHYSSNILLECIISPEDVVSVPTDYNSSKVRVCRLQVMGYSPKEARSKQVIKLSDFIKDVPQHVIDNTTTKSLKEGAVKETVTISPKTDNKTQESGSSMDEIASLSASQIIEYVKTKTGTMIEITVKNKVAIVKKAVEILDRFNASAVEILDRPKQEAIAHQEQSSLIEAELNGMSAKQIVDHIQTTCGVDISHINIKNKGKIIKEAILILSIQAENKELVTAVIESVAHSKVEEPSLYSDTKEDADKPMFEEPITQEMIEDARTAITEVNEKLQSNSTANPFNEPEPQKQTINLTAMSRDEKIVFVKNKFNEKIGGFLVSDTKVHQRATEIFEKAGYIVV